MEQQTNFDLFIGMCDEPIINVESFIKRIEESEFGKYVNIRPIKADAESIQMRNLSAGSIQFVAYLSAKGVDEPAMHWGTGFSRVAVCSEGVCIYAKNINTKVKTHIEMTEDTLFNGIKNAFYWILDMCKQLHFNITGDELGVSNYK